VNLGVVEDVLKHRLGDLIDFVATVRTRMRTSS
jgi:hypothetical protein